MTFRKTTTARLTAITLFVISILAINATATLAEDSLTVTMQNNDEVVYINAGSDIQSVINRHPAGTTFILRSGIHRMQTIRPRYGDTYIGEPNAIMNGSRVLTNWRREGNYWVADGQTQQNRVIDIPGWNDRICEDGYERCRHPEDVFIDHEPLTHVTSLSQVGPGSWYFDYGANRIYIGEDPNGHLVETSVTDHAFVPHADRVTIRNLIVEKYANPVQQPAILAYGSYDWIVDGVTARLNHSSGIGLGHRMQITNNRAIHNGQIGIAGIGDDVVVYGNEIAYNNWAHFNQYWEAGGTKFVRTNRLLVSNNYVHSNYGVGLWTDIDNVNSTIEDNIVFNNARIGIYHEISYAAVIRNNIVKSNNVFYMPGVYGGQIQVAESSDTEVYGNTVVVNAAGGNGISVVNTTRGSGSQGEWWSHNNYVHHNTIVHLRQDGFSGVQVHNYDIDRFWREHNNRFDYNTYYVLNESHDKLWKWHGGSRSLAEMNNYGQERNAEIRVGVPQGANLIPAWGNSLVAYEPRQDVELELEVTALYLVDADTDQIIGELEDGAVIDLETMPNTLDVVAQTKSDVRSVRFHLNDQSRTESMAPYVLWGDDNNGDYYGWTPTVGTYNLRAVPFSVSGAEGLPGVEKSVEFTVVMGSNDTSPVTPEPTEEPTEEPTPEPSSTPDANVVDLSVTSFTLVNADDGSVIDTIADGDEINLNILPTRNLNIVAETSGEVGSVTMSLSDGTNRLENNAPYTMWGNEGDNYVAWTPDIMSYTIEATPYTARYAGGEAGESLTITISFIDETIIEDDTAPGIENLVLVNADTGETIMNLSDGLEIALNELPTQNLNIKAMTNDAVNSVMMSLDDASRMENSAPYALWGDTFWRDDNGSYNAWTPNTTTYTFEALPYSETSGRGTAGQMVSYRVTFVDTTPPPPTSTPQPVVNMSVTNFMLINADSNQPIMTLRDGQRINIDDLPTRNLNVQAITDGDVESVRVEVNGSSRLENGAPYAVWGDRSGNYTAWTPELRDYSFTAVPFSRNNARGTQGDAHALTITFVRPQPTSTPIPPTSTPQPVVNMSVTGFALINADSDQQIMTLSDGQQINLSTLPTRNLNVQVMVNGSVESVRVSYDSTSRVENGAPYSVLGDMNGNYTAWIPQTRAYTMIAIPYAQNDASGQAGAQQSITVTFVDQQQTQPQNPPNNGGEQPGNEQPVVVVPEQPGNNTGISVTGFTLINADTNQPIAPLNAGATVDLAAMPTRNLNIRADVAGQVGSMTISINDHIQQESAAPFSVWGDEPVGDYLNWSATVGNYTMTATPYTGSSFNGQTGTPLTINFNITDTAMGVSNPSPNSTGLNATIFDEPNFTGATVTRRDATVNFDWNINAPANGIGEDGFSIRWTGWIVPEYTETYTFYTYADDGTRLWINDTLVIDDWSNHAAREVSGTITLQAGVSYSIRLEYYDNIQAALVSLSWSSPSVPKAIIPERNLFTADPGNSVISDTAPNNGVIVIGQGTPVNNEQPADNPNSDVIVIGNEP